MMNPNMNNMMNNLKDINNMMMSNQNNKEQLVNLINQNIQMANQIVINNNMIKTLIENSNFGNDNQQSLFNSNLSNIDLFPGNTGKKINVVFEYDSHTIITVITPIDTKMSELLKVFYIKFQLYAKSQKKNIRNLNEYFFIHSARIISLNEQKTLQEFGLVHPFEHIIFKLKNEIIGG